MPTYTFMNLESGIEYDETMPMSEYDEYVKNNNVQRVYQPIALSADHLMGVGPKNDSGFNDVMGKIADGNPLSPMADRYGTSKTASQRRARDTFSKVTKKYKNKLDNLNKRKWCGRENHTSAPMHSIYASWEVNPPLHQRGVVRAPPSL